MQYDACMPDDLEELRPPETIVRPQPIAPWFHTLSLLCVLALWAASSALRLSLNLPTTIVSHYSTYTSSIIMQVLLVGSTIAGLYHRRQFVASVLGSFGPKNLPLDIAIGIATYAAALSIAGLLGHAIHLNHRTDVVRAMLPQSLPELVLWLVVSLAAGTCEEFVFRGYLQWQLSLWLRSVPLSIGIVSVLFGCLHFYQGPGGVLQVIALGATYGTVAAWRGNIRSVMIAHFLQDAITGITIYFRHS
jgi:hypothetical protein